MAGKLLNSFQVSKGDRVIYENHTEADLLVKTESDQGDTEIVKLRPLQTIAINPVSKSYIVTIYESDQDTQDG